MTKYEVRMVTMGMLGIEQGDVLLDIGAGTGSVSVEAAMQGAKVYAIEAEVEGVALIAQNAAKFSADVTVIQGKAPGCLEEIEIFNKCFIGGSKRKLSEILDTINEKLPSRGTVAANFITIDNVHVFKKWMQMHAYKDLEITLLQSSKMKQLSGMIIANNPIFIAKGVKK